MTAYWSRALSPNFAEGSPADEGLVEARTPRYFETSLNPPHAADCGAGSLQPERSATTAEEYIGSLVRRCADSDDGAHLSNLIPPGGVHRRLIMRG